MTEALRTFQGLTFSCPSPSCLRLVGPSPIELYYWDGEWQLWGRSVKTGETILCHTARSRDDLISIIAWARGLRDSLPEGFVDGGPSKG